jgi:hypothetical protein
MVTYIPIRVSLAANGTLIQSIRGGRIRIHYIFGQAAAAVEGDIVCNQVNLSHFKFNDREGWSSSFASYPGYIMMGEVNGNLTVVFTTAAQCYFTIVYSEEGE